MSDQTWFLYVVECADASLYTGITTDLNRRIDEHNRLSRGAKYTRSRRPVRLIYSKRFSDRSAASSAEAKFKRLARRKKLEVISEDR